MRATLFLALAVVFHTVAAVPTCTQVSKDSENLILQLTVDVLQSVNS
jgi:hypothetical protein